MSFLIRFSYWIREGNTIIGSEGIDSEKLMKLAQKEGEKGAVITSNYEYEGNTYLVTCNHLSENGWLIFGLKSRETLLGSLKSLRDVIFRDNGTDLFRWCGCHFVIIPSADQLFKKAGKTHEPC